MTDNTPEAPKPFSYSPTSGTTQGMSDATPRGPYAARVMPVPGVVYAPVPNVTPGVTIIPAEVVPTVAPEQSKQ